MASFGEELRRASEELARFNREAQRATDGTKRREQEAERSFLGTALGLGGGVGGLARGLTPAAGALSASGSFNDAADVASSTVIEALARTSIGGFLAAGTGVSRQINARADAREQVIGELAPLAARDVPLSDDFVQNLIDVRVAQQERVQALARNVTTRTAYTPADLSGDTLGGEATGDVLGRLADVLEKLSGAVDKINPFKPGGQ